MGPVLAADSTTLQKLQIHLVRQSRGFEALARFPPCEMFSRGPPQFGINDGDHAVQRIRSAVVPCRQHSGDIVVSPRRHADRNPIKKDHRALTVPPGIRGIEVEARISLVCGRAVWPSTAKKSLHQKMGGYR